jgi:hypothetical protein
MFYKPARRFAQAGGAGAKFHKEIHNQLNRLKGFLFHLIFQTAHPSAPSRPQWLRSVGPYP